MNSDITSSFDTTATEQSTRGDEMDVDGEESNPRNENGNESDARIDNRSKNSKSSGISDELANSMFDTSDMFSSFSKSCPGIYHNNDICCLAKMYNCNEGTFRLNDVIEIIGIYTTDPILTSVHLHGQGENASFEQLIDPLGGFDDDDSQSLPPPRYSIISIFIFSICDSILIIVFLFLFHYDDFCLHHWRRILALIPLKNDFLLHSYLILFTVFSAFFNFYLNLFSV